MSVQFHKYFMLVTYGHKRNKVYGWHNSVFKMRQLQLATDVSYGVKMFMKLTPRGDICAANTTQADTIKVPWTAVCDSFELKQATHFFPLFLHTLVSFSMLVNAEEIYAQTSQRMKASHFMSN